MHGMCIACVRVAAATSFIIKLYYCNIAVRIMMCPVHAVLAVNESEGNMKSRQQSVLSSVSLIMFPSHLLCLNCLIVCFTNCNVHV